VDVPWGVVLKMAATMEGSRVVFIVIMTMDTYPITTPTREGGRVSSSVHIKATSTKF